METKRDDTQDQEEEKFEGFDSPTSNYFPMPNIWIEICSKIKSLAEIKVVQYVLRHTWGYQEYGITKAITTDEFMFGRKRRDGSRMDSGTGLSNRAVITALAEAVKSGYLVCDVDDSDKGRIVKSYALNMKAPDEGHTDEVRYEKSSHLNKKSDMKKVHRGMKEVHSHHEKSSYRTEKETIERNLEKEKEYTAQSPIGSVLNVSSPPSAHTQEDEPTLPPALQSTINNIGSKRSNPCPLSPPTEEKKPGRKPKELTVTETAVLDKWEDLQGSPVDRHKKDMRDAASYFAGLIEQGRMALDDIALERAAFLKQFPYSQTGHITLPQLHTKISTGGRAIKNSPIVIDAPSQEDKPSRYDDPNFDPRTLSNTESIEYNAWLNAHPRPVPVLA